VSELERRAWSPQGKELRAVGCNLCGSARARWLARENGLDVVRCRECSLVYVTPQPSQRELERFYADYYPEGSEARWRELMAPVFARDARGLAAALPARGRVLDVGTGFGHFLDALRAEGFDAEGLESSALARERLAARGLRAHAGMMPDVVLPAEGFDAITASMVLEHVADPMGFLRRARELLRPGGLLFVRVPNFALLRAFLVAGRLAGVPGVRAAMRVVRREMMDEATLFHVIGPPGHLHGWEPRTLAAALAGAGFDRVRLEGDPMLARGSWLNRVIDGSAYAAARVLRTVSRGRLEISPNLSAWAWKARGAVGQARETCASLAATSA
jgi:2-polyprenyl-3-methyl-5-hydroxy-6-metoxy-1,4-benzoquinol methylase